MQKMPKKPSLISLTVLREFRASHSLAGFEVPHFHLWKLAVGFQSPLPLKSDRLIDLIFLQTLLDEIIAPLNGTYLNESFSESPTSENMALWIWDKVVCKAFQQALHE